LTTRYAPITFTYMKTAIAVTLIVMGGFLVMTPAVSDLFYQRNVVTLMSQPGINRVTLDGRMGEAYRFACWLTGSVMIGAAVKFSMSGSKVPGLQTTAENAA
jgi:hypothetical protein